MTGPFSVRGAEPGDGHALQRDGEPVGTRIDVSMDVRLRVDRIKDRKIYWPRAENETYIMTIGNVRPLDQCVKYDIGNMLDPPYTMVCKL